MVVNSRKILSGAPSGDSNEPVDSVEAEVLIQIKVHSSLIIQLW